MTGGDSKDGTGPAPVGEDELHAFVDGALPAERMAQVEAWLAARPAEAGRARAWRRQNADFHRLFDPVLDEPVPERLRPAAVRARRRRRRPLLADLAAALALLALGLAGGWWLHGSLGPDAAPGAGTLPLALDAMSAHRVYAVEVRHPVEVPAAEHGHLVGWLSKRLGMALRTPDLRPAGFALVGGRLLPARDGAAWEPAAQFMYEDPAGQRITLYLRAAGATAATAFRFASEGTANAFYWTEAGLSYALVGEIERARLSALADLAYRNLAGNDL